ncbi:MAG TPA: hypothetical protein VGK23_11915 [Methanomassiliicoccales archaeon]|jgi:hypothetical protein
MRKETMNPKMPNWNLERIPASPTYDKGRSSNNGVVVTEIDSRNDGSNPVGSWTGYPYVSLKK